MSFLNFLKELGEEFAEAGAEIKLQHKHEVLKQKVGSFGYNGQIHDAQYYREHGETPAEKRLREFEQGELKHFYDKDRYII